MLRKLKRIFKRKPAPSIVTTSREPPIPSPPPYHISTDIVSFDSALDLPEALFNHNSPPPAARWSAPPHTSPPAAPQTAPLYRDECIRLHHEVRKLHQAADRLEEANDRLEQTNQVVVRERDHAAGMSTMYIRCIRDCHCEVAEARLQVRQFQARMNSLEKKRWRRAMRAQVEAAENRAIVAEEELRLVRRQMEEIVEGRQALEEGGTHHTNGAGETNGEGATATTSQHTELLLPMHRTRNPSSYHTVP